MGECTVYWDGNVIQNTEDSVSATLSEAKDGNSSNPVVSVSKDQSGFMYVLARPADSHRTVALTLESHPESGVYEFRPLDGRFDFRVRLEYQDEPYPEPRMHVLDVSTELSAVEVGDAIEIGLRKNQTEAPGIEPVTGTVSEIMDFSGLVPDLPDFYPDPTVVLSLLVRFDGEPPSDDYLTAIRAMSQRRLNPISDSFGCLDVVGDEQPLDLQWEGRSDTPALQVELVRINGGTKSELTVENESLPDVQFDDLATRELSDRISMLESVFSDGLDRSVAAETLEFFADAVDECQIERTIKVKYDSSRSENTLTKSGTVTGTRSVYYAEENRAKHQVRFSGSDGRFYILLDLMADTDPATVYSVSLARHWDTELGPLVDYELTE